MKIVWKEAHVIAQKIIADISPAFAKCYNLPEDHKNVAFFSCTNDDVAFIAADDATKKANVTVRHAATFYGGTKGSWSRYGGCVFVIMSGPRVEDVKNGLSYVNDFVENHCELGHFDGIPAFSVYAQCVPRVGTYYRDLLGIPEGSAYAYLLGPSTESNYALDQALKSGDVKLARYWYPPAKINSSGGIIYGSEAACRAAKEAFVQGLHYAFENPLLLQPALSNMEKA